ncbi:hypothetical protein [Paenibacillus sp. NPDC055715]
MERLETLAAVDFEWKCNITIVMARAGEIVLKPLIAVIQILLIGINKLRKDLFKRKEDRKLERYLILARGCPFACDIDRRHVEHFEQARIELGGLVFSDPHAQYVLVAVQISCVLSVFSIIIINFGSLHALFYRLRSLCM